MKENAIKNEIMEQGGRIAVPLFEEEAQTTDLIEQTSVFAGPLPDLTKAEPAPLELNSEYWSPNVIGEKKRLFFKELRTEKAIDQQSGEMVDLLVAYFVEVVDGKKVIVRQAGRRLTAVFENFSREIRPGMAFEITYLGKERNRSNMYESGKWSIVPLSTEKS